jgi:glucosamine 6-phosphate synthetase-like amidotransferase/phosphosugar isomerase protein
VKKQWMALFFEKIAVAAAALEKQAICFQSIDENPIRLGNDVDMPRNLAKSVTVE